MHKRWLATGTTVPVMKNLIFYILGRKKLARVLTITSLLSANPSRAGEFHPQFPPIHTFSECMLDPSPQPQFKEIESCLQANWKALSYSPPVDGNPNIRHIAWKLWRFTNEMGTAYQLQQYAYSCETGFMIERTMRSYIDPNQTNSYSSVHEPSKWSNTSAESQEHRRYCPE